MIPFEEQVVVDFISLIMYFGTIGIQSQNPTWKFLSKEWLHMARMVRMSDAYKILFCVV
jgi:hypothetical protein